MKMSRMQTQQYIKDLKAVIKRQKKIIETQKIAMAHIVCHIDIHNGNVRRLIQKAGNVIQETLTKGAEEHRALINSTDSD